MTPARVAPLAVGLIALAVWAVLAVLEGAPAFQGWLVGFLFVSGLSLGSLATVLIHRLTAGRWGPAFAPELEPAARTTPLLCLYALPVVVGAGLIYSWAMAPGALKPGVGGYLNLPFFIARSAVVLAGWSAIALFLPRIEGPRGRLWAGVGLAFHGIAVSVVSVDWIASVLPSWTSSNIGMDLAAQQFAAAFALAALQGRRRAADEPAADIAGLLFATIIGLVYLEFMSFLVVWYGDKPDLDAWYIARNAWPWRAAPLMGLAFGVAAVALLAGRRAFGTHRAVAMAGGCVLAALIAYQVWLVAPAFGVACLVPAAFALVGQTGVWLALTGGSARLFAGREAAAHG